MKLDTFFDNFGLLADAPNGVQKLREMILQLAVQGKLVPQDPEDEPASVLLEKINAEKERFVKENKFKKSKPLPAIKSDEIDYDLPDSWEWVRLGNISNYGEGGKISSNDIPEDAWLLDLADIEKHTSRIVKRVKFKNRISKSTKAEFNKGDVLYGKLRPYLNKVVVADDKGFCTTEIIPIRGYSGIFPKYLMYSLRSPRFLEYVNSKTYGTKMPRLGTGDAKNSLFPLPPTNEQKRIVAKVDELMALCDELELRKQNISENCIQLNDASIYKLLTAREPKKFRKQWKRICDNFDLLYNKPENVTKLRQAVLQLAVQGKLVPQYPEDEPASVLLEKIKAKKERLIKEKKVKKDKPLTPISQDQAPYSVPSGWQWTRLGELTISMINGIYKQARYYSDQGIGCLRMYNINDGKINFGNLKKMVLEDQELDTYQLIEGDLLVNRVNSRELVGKAGVIGKYDEPLVFESKNIRVRLAELLILPHYINILFRTNQVRKVFEGDAKQTCGQASISQPQIAGILTPLPPLNEQKRIVAKVDELMALCDELETRLSQSQTDCDRLMEAAVTEILAA